MGALATVLGLLLGGCASLSPDPPPNPAEGPRFQPAALAVVPARFQPVARLDPIGRSKGEAAAEGAVMGGTVGAVAAVQAAGAISAGVSGGLTLSAGPLAAALLPVFATLGAVVGAVAEQREAAPQALIEQGRAAMDRLIAGQAVQQRLQAAYLEALREESLPDRTDIGPDAAQASGSHASAGLPPVLDVAVVDLGFRPAITSTGRERQGYELVTTLRARLLAADGTTVLDALDHTLHSDAHTATRWLQDDAALFPQALAQVLQRSARMVVLEFFRLYYPPAAHAPTDDRRRVVPYFALDALYPPPRQGLDLRGIYLDKYAGGFGLNQFTAVEDLEPVFRWEGFPRPVDAAGPARRFSQVRYEFRLYEAALHRQFGVESYVPAALVYARDGLEAPLHRLQVPLAPCGRYAWTVRARFRYNDAEERVTEWTGAYTQLGTTHQPWKWRRGLDQRALGTLGAVDSSHLFLLLRAPPAPGQRSCVG